MHGMDSFMANNCTTSAPDTRKATIHVPVKSYFFFHTLLSGDIKLSDLEFRDSYLPITALIMSKLNTTMKHKT